MNINIEIIVKIVKIIEIIKKKIIIEIIVKIIIIEIFQMMLKKMYVWCVCLDLYPTSLTIIINFFSFQKKLKS